MKKILIALLFLMSCTAMLYAGSGDLIVNGKLGVGNTSPTGNLDVNGTLCLNGNCAASLPTPAGSFSNLVVKNNATTPGSKIDISADAIALTDGTCHLTARGISLTIDASAVGANGLDSGSLAASTHYCRYVIFNPTTQTVAGLLSASATNPVLPSGYTYKKKLPCTTVTDESIVFREFRQHGGKLFYNARISVLTLGQATAWTAVNLSSAVPYDAHSVDLIFYATAGAADTGNALLSVDNSNTWFSHSGGTLMNCIYGQAPLLTAQTVWYKIVNSNTKCNMFIAGYECNL